MPVDPRAELVELERGMLKASAKLRPELVEQHTTCCRGAGLVTHLVRGRASILAVVAEGQEVDRATDGAGRPVGAARKVLHELMHTRPVARFVAIRAVARTLPAGRVGGDGAIATEVPRSDPRTWAEHPPNRRARKVVHLLVIRHRSHKLVRLCGKFSAVSDSGAAAGTAQRVPPSADTGGRANAADQTHD